MFETEEQRLAALEARRATIQRAIDHMHETGLDDPGLRDTLREIGAREHLQEDPPALVELLESALRPGASTGHRFGAWKISQRICQAVGLPY